MRTRLNQFEMFVEHWKLSVLKENNVVLNENSVEGKKCIDRESKSLELTIYLYRCYDGQKDPRSCNTTVYLSRLIHLEDVLGGKFHR